MSDTESETDGLPEMPVARIVGGKPREQMVPIEFPVEFAGITYEAIRIRRVSGKEIADYFDSFADGGAFKLPPVVDCPVEVWEALDADDQDTVDAAAQAFMPRRLKAAVKFLETPGALSSDS